MADYNKVWNPFRNWRKRDQFSRLVQSYITRSAPLFDDEGWAVRNSFNAHFWAGYHGQTGPLYQPKSPAYRRSPSFIWYEAGRIIRHVEVE